MNLSERIAVVSVICVLCKFALAGLSVKVGGFAFTIGTVDAASLAAVLTPVLGALHLGNYIGGKAGGTGNDKA